MAGFKKVVLTEKDNSITQSVDVGAENATEKAVQEFDNSYSAKKLNELYDEFDNISLDDMTADKVETMPKTATKASVKTKIYLTAGAFVAVLLMFLVIYNFVVINSLNGGIKLLQDEVSYKEYQISNKVKNLNELTDASTLERELIENGYVQLEDGNRIIINTSGSANSGQALKGDSNWFDSFCNFISSVFGG